MSGPTRWTPTCWCCDESSTAALVDESTASYEGEAEINSLSVNRARRVAVVVDSSKIGQAAFARIYGLGAADELITGNSPSNSLVVGR